MKRPIDCLLSLERWEFNDEAVTDWSPRLFHKLTTRLCCSCSQLPGFLRIKSIHNGARHFAAATEVEAKNTRKVWAFERPQKSGRDDKRYPILEIASSNTLHAEIKRKFKMKYFIAIISPTLNVSVLFASLCLTCDLVKEIVVNQYSKSVSNLSIFSAINHHHHWIEYNPVTVIRWRQVVS